MISRDEEWGTGGSSGGGNNDNKDYDGPAGMDVDGVIESTWTEVIVIFEAFVVGVTYVVNTKIF